MGAAYRVFHRNHVTRPRACFRLLLNAYIDYMRANTLPSSISVGKRGMAAPFTLPVKPQGRAGHPCRRVTVSTLDTNSAVEDGKERIAIELRECESDARKVRLLW